MNLIATFDGSRSRTGLEAVGAALGREGVTFLQPPDGTLMVIADPERLAIEIWRGGSE